MKEHNGANGANISEQERLASLLAGGALALLGLQQGTRQRWPAAMGFLALGGALLYRGVTRHCMLYASLGKNRTKPGAAGKDGQAAPHKIEPSGDTMEIAQVVTINRPAPELYDFWRRGEGIAELSPMLKEVRVHGGDRWEWVASAPGGHTMRWESVITEDRPGEMMRWQARGEDGRALYSGLITFHELPHERGTEVKLQLSYDAPDSVLGAALARIFGAIPSHLAQEMLRHFKQLMEAGELAQAA